MPTSAAKLVANRRNGMLSQGPLSDETKKISRQNSLKHGLTGAGIVLPNEDVEALEAKIADFEAALKPQDAVQQELVERVALMSVRLNRSARQEAKAISMRMRNAASEYDDAKMAEAEHLISWIASEPVTNNRRLKGSPYGIRRLIEQVDGLRSELTRQPNYRWEYQHCDQLHHYLGMRRENMPITRIRALSEAIQGKFENIDPSEIPESETLAKRRWAIRELVELIDIELAKLKALLENFDPAAIELDRAEAPERAMVDSSKESILGRKYEAACERAMHKALKELKALQAEPAQVDTEEPDGAEPSGELGSFSETPAGRNDTEAELDPTGSRRRPNLEKLTRKGRRKSKSA